MNRRILARPPAAIAGQRMWMIYTDTCQSFLRTWKIGCGGPLCAWTTGDAVQFDDIGDSAVPDFYHG